MSQGMTKSSKILQFVNYRMRVTIADGRQMVGKFMAFDKHLNIVLGDCEEFRRIPVRGGKDEEQEQRRTLGLIILRGEGDRWGGYRGGLGKQGKPNVGRRFVGRC